MKEPRFKIGDEVFLFEKRSQDQNGIRAKIEKSEIRKVHIGGSGGLVGFEGYTLANGTSSKGDNLYSLREFQEKISQFLTK